MILGDRIINVIEKHNFIDGLGNDERVCEIFFWGRCRSDAKPRDSFENNLVILHCGTHDLRGNNSAEGIATNIVNLAKEMKSEKMKLWFRRNIPRKDNLNEKGIDVNNFLITFRKDFNFNFIDNSKGNRYIKGQYVLGRNLLHSIRL